MKPRTERPDRKHGGSAVVLLVAVVMLLPVLYLASIGPVTWLDSNGYINSDYLRPVYFPIGWAMEKSETFADAVIWYCELWE